MPRVRASQIILFSIGLLVLAMTVYVWRVPYPGDKIVPSEKFMRIIPGIISASFFFRFAYRAGKTTPR